MHSYVLDLSLAMEISWLATLSGQRAALFMNLLHWPTLTTRKPNHGQTADLTNICINFAAAVSDGLEDSLTLNSLLQRLPHDIAKVEKSPEYLYPEAVRGVLD